MCSACLGPSVSRMGSAWCWHCLAWVLDSPSIPTVIDLRDRALEVC